VVHRDMTVSDASLKSRELVVMPRLVPEVGVEPTRL
jgi:hypothetical protein